MKKITVLLLTLFSFQLTNNFAQTSLYKNAAVTAATCGEDNGSIKVEAPFFVNTVWENGSTQANREQLSPGTYTLSGIDESGCSETITFEVPNISCDFELTYTYPIGLPNNPGEEANDHPSRPEICVYVGFIFTVGGVPIANEYLDISWAVTVPPMPPFPSYTYYSTHPYIGVYANNVTIEYTVSLKNQSLSCCSFSDVVYPGSPCKTVSEPPKVYVSKSTFSNEANKSQVPGIVELLIYGDGTCGETMDLRGYIVDDNNGDLIYANQTNLTNGALLKINPGYLRFSDDPNWAAVPHGSLITIYNSAHLGNNSLQAKDDPTDIDANYHYVLSAENAIYFEGKNSSWSVENQLTTYEGETITPSWELIKPDGEAGAIQVRYPDGSYCHGVSYGKTAISAVYNFFPLHLTETPHDYCQIHMQALSYLDKTAFEIHEIYGGFVPGQTESIDLAAAVNYLRNCGSWNDSLTQSLQSQNVAIINQASSPTKLVSKIELEETTIPEEDRKIELETSLTLSPNPFKQYLAIQYQGAVTGSGNIQIFDIRGKLILSKAVEIEQTIKTLTIDFKQHAAGVYLIKFQLPDHKSITKKVVLTNIN
ncbi:MAG: T9SS type A sorting domain-containing protein [Saprospiraceae bacterium]